jgi:hypothetical protein
MAMSGKAEVGIQAKPPQIRYVRSKMDRFLVSKGIDTEFMSPSAMQRKIKSEFKLDYETWREPRKR